MNYRDIQKPLVQTALVLLAILVVIGFVAGSDANSFWGGIVSIIKGAIYTVLFAFALVLSLIFSVVLLIAIFLGAVSLYSSDKAKEMYTNIRQRTTDIYFSWTNSAPHHKDASSFPASQKDTLHSDVPLQEESQFASAASLVSLEQKLSKDVAEIKQTLDTLNNKSASLDNSFADLQDNISTLPGAEIIERLNQLEMHQNSMEEKLEKNLQKLEKKSDTAALEQEKKRLSKELSTFQEEIADVSKGLDELRASFSQLDISSKEPSTPVSEEEPRIFAYLGKDAEKKQFAKYVAEAVEKEMTYAEIDDFLSKSLPKKVDTIIKEHPSLTKEYIRACKNR